METRKNQMPSEAHHTPKALLTLPKNTPVKDIIEYLAALKKMNIDSVMIKVELFHF
jgi:hypothetical protein